MTTTVSKNFKQVTFLQQPGRRMERGKVQIYRGGTTMRISRDLVKKLIGTASDEEIPLVPFVDKKGRQLALKFDTSGKNTVLYTWKSSPKSKSVLVSVVTLLQLLGIDRDDAPGTYNAKVQGDTLYINF